MGKIRITLLDKQTNQEISDRLVETSTEFNIGPKDKHEGPIRLAITLTDKAQIEGLIDYLSKLALDLPLSSKPAAKRTYNKTTNLAEEQKMDLLQIIEKTKDIETAIQKLRDTNYAFLCWEHLQDIATKNDWAFNLKSEKHESHQFMARVLRVAKDPKNDQVDISLVFAIKLVGTRFDRIHVYEGGKYTKTIKILWAERKEIGFKVKEKFFKFPKPMTYEERAKWRAEDRRVQNALTGKTGYKASSFYERWVPFIERLKPRAVKSAE